MSYDFLVTYDWLVLDDLIQKKAIDYLVGKRTQPPEGMQSLAEVSDPATRINLLILALRSAYKEYARTGDYREPGGLIQSYRDERSSFRRYLTSQINDYLAPLEIVPDQSRLDLSLFPLYTTFIQFTFTLAAPYISRDDDPFHINDNPVKKDKVFNVPMVAPAGWKGALRAALWHELGKETEEFDKDESICRLFGHVTEQEEGNAGCLHFYPTFFDSIGMEVINPHDRAKGTGKLPIYFECVPIGATGTFSLLSVPMPTTTAQDVAKDITLLERGIAAMFTTYGFGAKTSSGYGVAANTLKEQGILMIRTQQQVSTRSFNAFDRLLPETEDIVKALHAM